MQKVDLFRCWTKLYAVQERKDAISEMLRTSTLSPYRAFIDPSMGKRAEICARPANGPQSAAASQFPKSYSNSRFTRSKLFSRISSRVKDFVELEKMGSFSNAFQTAY